MTEQSAIERVYGAMVSATKQTIDAGKPPTVEVWVYPPLATGAPSTSGRGSAGGCGYHKESAALEDAFASAGVKFEAHFNGAGEAAMVRAIATVGAFFGVEGKVI